MLNELAAIYGIVDKLLEKRKVSNEQRIRDKVLIALYELGNKGSRAVSPDELESNGGFSKIQISDAVDMAKSKGWIIDASSHSGIAWMLKREAIYHVEGLLESAKDNQ